MALTKRKEEISTIMDAYWQYMIEHSDITVGGAFFVKFHTRNRADFEKHVRARWKFDYKRLDERMGNIDHAEKEKIAAKKREERLAKKNARQLSYKEQKKAMRKVVFKNNFRITVKRTVEKVKKLFTFGD